jgi:hypothetical protein
MGDVLERAVKAHGGIERWREVSRFRVRTSIGGAIWTLKGKPGLLDRVTLDGDARRQQLTITPFPRPGQVATWTPERQAIEAADGTLVAERPDPAAPFAGQTRESPWDDLQAAYFASEANWNYYVAPFILAEPGFGTEETGPWEEDGQVWQRLLVTYPDSIVAHTRQQTYYFDDSGLLRRLDYQVDILGGGPAVHYPSRYRRFDGIMVPTRRRVYVRRADGSPILESTSIAIDVDQVSFS